MFIFALAGMAHRKLVALLLLSAVVAAVVGHSHEEGNLAPGEDVLNGLQQGKMAIVGESTGKSHPLFILYLLFRSQKTPHFLLLPENSHWSTVAGTYEDPDESALSTLVGKPKKSKVGALEAKHIKFLHLLSESKRVYCKVEGGVFCQLLKGLRRQYFGAVRTGNNKDYENYVLKMNIRFCTGPNKNLKSKQCKLMPTFIHQLPDVTNMENMDSVGKYIVNPAKQDEYLEKQTSFYQGLENMATDYCASNDHHVFCGQLEGLAKHYRSTQAGSHMTVKEAVTVRAKFKTSFDEVHKQYCERKIDEMTSRCKEFAKLKEVPQAFGLAHPHPHINLLKKDMDVAQQKYSKHLEDMQEHSCGDGGHAIFCEIVVGMRQSFAAAVHQKKGTMHTDYLTQVVKSVCDSAPESKRCASMKLTVANYSNMEKERKKPAAPIKVTPKGPKKTSLSVLKDVTSKLEGLSGNVTSELAEANEETKKSTMSDDEQVSTLNRAMDETGVQPEKKKGPQSLDLHAQQQRLHRASSQGTHTRGKDVTVGHMKNLTPDQDAYRRSLNDVAKHYCTKAQDKGFCTDATSLKLKFDEALHTQQSRPFEKFLAELRFTQCKTKKTQSSKKCKVLAVFAKTMVSVAHSGPDSTKRLHQMQRDYLDATQNAAAQYCAADEASLVCQATRGLEREYMNSMEHKTNIAYEHYLTNMENQFCSTPVLTRKNPSRCVLFTRLRKSMPISMTTLKDLPQKHAEFISTVSDVSGNFCSGTGDTSLFCELARGIKRVYIHSLNVESNADFDFYLTRIEDKFCVLPTPEMAKGCAVLPVLKSGVPPAFLAEGFKRPLESTHATERISAAQKVLHKRLHQDRMEYLHSLQDVYNHYCVKDAESHPTYFCSLVDGLVKNFEYSITSETNEDYKDYLSHMERDFCVRGAADGYDKRCKFIPMLKNGLPLSVKEEKALYHEQGEYLKAIQDIVGHFCYKMTKSVFCQLCHGLVTQFISAVVAQSNEGFKTYIDNMQAHYCDITQGDNSKQCQIFPVLRKGLPGVGLGGREALTTAANREGATASELQRAQQARKLAQEAVKRNPTQESLATLERATHNELQAEKMVQQARIKVVHQLAENAGAPSTMAISVAIKHAKDLEGLAIKAKQNAVDVKFKTTTDINKAKELVLQTANKVASATAEVKKETSPETVKAVEAAMNANQEAKESLVAKEKESEKSIHDADTEATDISDRAVAAREKVIELKADQKKRFAQFAYKNAQQSADNAEEAAVFAQANAKSAAQKYWWAKVYAKENPSAENEQKVAEAAKEADDEAAIVKAMNKKETSTHDTAQMKSEDLMNIDKAAMADADTETAHSKVKKAMLDHSRAEQAAAKEVSELKGSVPAKQIADAKAKATSSCAASTVANNAAAKTKAALNLAAAQLKASQNTDSLDKIRAAQRDHKAAEQEAKNAESVCEQAKSLADKLSAGAGDKTALEASTSNLVRASEVANRAADAVRQAKEEEQHAIKNKLFKLEHEVQSAQDHADLANEKSSRAAKSVTRLTDMVSNNPTEYNIATLKRALEKKESASRYLKSAEDALASAKKEQQAAMAEAATKTSDPETKDKISKQLTTETLSQIEALKKQLENAMTASSEAVKKVNDEPTDVNKQAEMAATEKVEKLKAELASASKAAGEESPTGEQQPVTIAALEAKLRDASKTKNAAQQFAMEEPTNENLDAFREQVRKVHSLQTELMIAHQQKETMAKVPRDPIAKETGIKGLVMSYCGDDSTDTLCSFYTPFVNQGFKGDEGEMAKYLLGDVVTAKAVVEKAELRVTSARAKAASNPIKLNKVDVTEAENNLIATKSAVQDADSRVEQFVAKSKHMKTMSNEGADKAQVGLQVAKLVAQYCQNNVYAKLCDYYTNMKRKHDEEVATPGKQALLSTPNATEAVEVPTNASETIKTPTNASETIETPANATNGTLVEGLYDEDMTLI